MEIQCIERPTTGLRKHSRRRDRRRMEGDQIDELMERRGMATGLRSASFPSFLSDPKRVFHSNVAFIVVTSSPSQSSPDLVRPSRLTDENAFRKQHRQREDLISSWTTEIGQGMDERIG
ncbi:hypothetical protein SCHPADRAFT_702239 [Schizopora paradoxa]|uniref:Uncharacterized protein n=1 Tax=Schizopora paradoxa TaxID=27342 RepID=A0A0H2R3Z6_9AGAM|nr:hypothetical protein SCHPADRAFT_702239 [Schizopora paradoxa]